MAHETYTEFGTRCLLLQNGGAVTLTKTESEMVVMSMGDSPPVLMTCQEVLCLIEYLAVAARVGTKKPYIELPADAGFPELP